MPICTVPRLASATPREEPPVCTSIRTPGWTASKRLAISPTSGATVLDPLTVSRPSPKREAPLAAGRLHPPTAAASRPTTRSADVT